MKYLRVKNIQLLNKEKKYLLDKKMIEQYRTEKYFIDVYFPEHKLGTEIDENLHLDKSDIKEIKREGTIKNLGISLIRINPDKEGFDIFIKIGEIQDFIYESALKLGEELKKNKMFGDLKKSVRLINMSV